MNTLLDFFKEFMSILNMMSPFLLLGFLFSGLLSVFIPKTIFQKHLAQNNMKSVFWAAALGIPLPLCSCGVIPTAMSLKKEGASNGATVSFLIATPQTGVDSILATYGLLGLPYAIIRPVFAFILAMFGGGLVNLWGQKKTHDHRPSEYKPEHKQEHKHKHNPIKEVFEYGFVSTIQDFGKWLVLGLVVAAAITAFIPSSYFEILSDNYILNILAILLVSIPMYVCATGSIPIALSLIMMGISPGAAMVLLIAGPATNMASIIVLRKVLGLRTTIMYIVSVIIGSIICAYTIDKILPQEWFSNLMPLADGACHHGSATPWWQIVSTIVFILLFINAFIMKFFFKSKSTCGCHNCHDTATSTPTPQRKVYKVSGMRCNHCKASVEKAFNQIPDVSFVVANPQENTLEIEGSISENVVKQTVEDLGFDFG